MTNLIDRLPSDQPWHFIEILLADVQVALDRQQNSEADEASRTLLRLMATTIEAMVAILSDHALMASTSIGEDRTAEEIVLSEKSYSIRENGTVAERDRFEPALAKFRLACRIVDRIADGDHIDFGSHQWSDAKLIFKLRNRITHPKHVDDLKITEFDIDEAKRGFFWIIGRAMVAMAICNDTMRQHVADMTGVLADLKSGTPEVVEAYARALAENQSEGR